MKGQWYVSLINLQDLKDTREMSLIYGLDSFCCPKISSCVTASLGMKGTSVNCDEERLPFPDKLFDASISFLSLQWSNDLPRI